MLRKLRPRSAYDVIALLALFVALGGTTYAAATIGAANIKDNAVRSRHIMNGEVKNADIQDQSVGPAKLRPGGVATGNLANGSVTREKLANGSVTREKLANESWQELPEPNGFPNCPDDGPGDTGVLCGANLDARYGWTNYGSGWARARFTKDADGLVHVEGLVAYTKDWGPGQDGHRIFRLPAGYRPTASLIFPAQCRAPGAGTKTGRIDVDADGLVRWPQDDGCEVQVSNGGFISLSTLTFPAEQ